MTSFQDIQVKTKSTTNIGQSAESRVAELLKKDVYKILFQNWRTKVCEIDLVAKKDNIIYFVEVKYRSSEKQGNGLDYILPRKLKQLHFSAQIWTQQNNWDGDYRLLAAGVSDDEYIEVVELD
jgi:putative endonuclease